MRKGPIIASGLLLSWCQCVFGLDPALDVSQYAHTAWRIEEGFPPAQVESIAQNEDGYLWLGTDIGLFRFDGVRTVQWRAPDEHSLPDNHIRSLLATRDGALWIGTWAGLARWKGDKLTTFPELNEWYINDLLEDRGGIVWLSALSLAARTGRLCSVRDDRLHCDGDDGRFGRAVGSLHQDADGRLWAATEASVWEFGRGEPKLRASTGPIPTYQTLADDEKGALLVATRTGIVRLMRDADKSSPAPVPRVESAHLLRDRDGALWIGATGLAGTPGLWHVGAAHTDTFGKSGGLSGENIWRMFEDREGDIWVATNQGLDRFHDTSVKTYAVAEGLSSPNVTAVIAARDGSTWISTTNGLNHWSSVGRRVYGYRGKVPEVWATQPAGPRVAVTSGLSLGEGSLLEDSRGRIWIATHAGVGYLENERYVPIGRVTEGFIDAITEDHTGTIWVAHELELLRIDGDRIVQRLPWTELGNHGAASRLVADPRLGGLWVGYRLGGVAHIADGHVRAFYSSANGLAKGRVYDLRVDSEGALWIASEGGLSVVAHGRIVRLDSRNGLPCDAVEWTIEDEAGAAWIATSCGLARIDRGELHAWSKAPEHGSDRRINATTVLGNSEGVRNAISLNTYSPHVARSTDGKLWFVTSVGVSVLDPRALHLNKLAPPVHIDQVIADRTTYVPAFRLELPSTMRELQVDYTAPSLVAPEKVLFRYKLEGYDHNWQNAGTRRQAFYTNLPPGDYRFHVIASNNSGVWNEKGASLDLSITPAFWQTTWFHALCVAAILAFLWMLYWQRMRQVAHEFDLKLESRVGERTRIARELHDTLLQSFQGLLLRFKTVESLLATRPDEARKVLESAIDQTREAITEGRRAVQALRSVPGEDREFSGELKALAEELARDPANIGTGEVLLNVEGAPRALRPLVRDELYRIASEALRNALRHASANRIEVHLEYGRREFELRVRDDGKGMDPGALTGAGRPGHFGLHGMRERAELAGGELALWSAVGAGTEIEVRIPASRAYAAGRG